MEANPLRTGVVSRSFGSTTGFKVKFCKMVVRNKNSSMWAKPSPTHDRFPEKKKKTEQNRIGTPGTLCFWLSKINMQQLFSNMHAIHLTSHLNRYPSSRRYVLSISITPSTKDSHTITALLNSESKMAV